MHTALHVSTESADHYVFLFDTVNPEQVVANLKREMNNEFGYISEWHINTHATAAEEKRMNQLIDSEVAKAREDSE